MNTRNPDKAAAAATLLGLYCGGSQFEFRPEHWMSGLKASVVYDSPSRQIPEAYLGLNDSFLPKALPIHPPAYILNTAQTRAAVQL